MRAQLRTANACYRIRFSIPLPDESTEIDVLIEDVVPQPLSSQNSNGSGDRKSVV